MELEKLLRAKLLWALLGVCLAVNAGILCMQLYYRAELSLLNDAAKQTGLVIDSAMRKQVDTLLEQRWADFDALYLKQQGCLPAHSTAMESSSPDGTNLPSVRSAWNISVYSKQQERLQTELLMLEKLHNGICGVLEDPAPIDIPALHAQRIAMAGDSRVMRGILTWQIETLTPRLEQINAVERASLSPNILTDMHTFLFATLLFACYLECALLAAVITLRSLRGEFAQGTAPIVYATKRGRRHQRDKGYAALLATLLCFGAICGTALTAYFLIYPQSAFWQMPISAQLNGNFVTKIPLTLGQYLGLNLLVACCLCCIFSRIAFVFGQFLKQAAFGIPGFLLFHFILMYLNFQSYTHFDSLPRALLTLNPMTLLCVAGMEQLILRNSAAWFSLRETTMSLPCFEPALLVLWALLCLLFAVLASRKFQKEEIV